MSIAPGRSTLFGSALVALAAVCALAGCGGDGAEPVKDVAATTGADVAINAIRETTEHGPLKATVTLTPKEPRLGDVLVLTLEVTSDPGVTVELPAFGEALGRFTIVDFTPRRDTDKDGRTHLSQRYTLQPPMSGRQRIPPLRIEFIDEREGQVKDGEEATADELLTEELRVEIASVLPEGQVADQLRPARGELEEILPTPLQRSLPWLALLLVASGVVAAVVYGRRVARERRRISAFDRALARMRKLEAAGLPAPDAADGWYVELSSIVRHYLEDRYGVRAPELTTEEFLREANRSAELGPKHRELLSVFLERCDRVKFSGYLPSEPESKEAILAARRFLEETRPANEKGSIDAPPPLSGGAPAA